MNQYFYLGYYSTECSICTCNGVFPPLWHHHSEQYLHLLPHLLKTDKHRLQVSPCEEFSGVFEQLSRESIYLEKTHQEARVQTKASDCKSKCGSILQVCGLVSDAGLFGVKDRLFKALRHTGLFIMPPRRLSLLDPCGDISLP